MGGKRYFFLPSIFSNWLQFRGNQITEEKNDKKEARLRFSSCLHYMKDFGVSWMLFIFPCPILESDRSEKKDNFHIYTIWNESITLLISNLLSTVVTYRNCIEKIFNSCQLLLLELHFLNSSFISRVKYHSNAIETRSRLLILICGLLCIYLFTLFVK